MGRYAGRDSTEVSTEGTAAVESEPANPEEEGPQYYICGIVELCILWRGLVSWRVLRRVERYHRSVYAVRVWCVVNTEKPREEGLDQREDREMEYAMARVVAPALICTAVPPAKSRTPHLLAQPSGLHVHRAIGS